MRKRSKKRIAQDVLPWVRVSTYSDDLINIFSKKTSRWVSGTRRCLQTKLLSGVKKKDFTDKLVYSMCNDQGRFVQLKVNKMSSKSSKAKKKKTQHS